MRKTKEFLPDIKELMFLALSAFVEEDNYANFSYANLQDVKLGQSNIPILLKELEQDNKIINHTINGYYNRFLIKNSKPCPEFIFNPDLNLTNKLFLLFCLQKLEHYGKRTAKQLALDLRQSESYSFESGQLTNIKQVLGVSIFDYLQHLKYIKKEPTHNQYPLIKNENGYQIDTYPEDLKNKGLTKSEKDRFRREKKLQQLLSESIGNYLMYRVQHRMEQNPERFTNSDLTVEYLNDLYIKQEGKDFYTKLPFKTLKDISVDRIDSSKPYTKNNIVLTSQTINIMKGTLEVSEFIDICKQIAAAN